MGETAPRQRAIITVASKPVMPPHIKMRHDAGRGRWLILAPERVFDPDEIAVAILKLCDGERTVGDIAGADGQRVQCAGGGNRGRHHRDVPGPRRQGSSEGMNESAPTHVKHVTEATVTMDAGEMRCDAASSPEPDPSCAVRAPIGLLAELTHRCPLQCPYCSNPLELEKVNTELTTAEWQKVMRQAGAARHSAGAPLGRRADGAPRPRRDRQGRGRSRPLHQPHHRRRAA